MKILCISSSYSPAFQFGGPITATHNLNKALSKKGVDVTVYTTNVGLEDKIKTNVLVNLDGVKVYYFEYFKLFEFLGDTGWQYSLKLKKALRENLKKFDVVFIVGIWNYPSTLAINLTAEFNIPCVVSPRGALAPDKFRYKAWKKQIYYNLFVKKNLSNASFIHYFTDIEAKKSLGFLKLDNQALILPNGINLNDFENIFSKENLRKKYPQLKNKLVFLFMGRIHWIKGLDILIKSFSELLKDNKDIHLLIAGPDEVGYKKKIEKLLCAKKIEENITFTGMLSGQDKMDVLAGSDVFVLPSYSEAFSMAVLEAMAAGLPVIISKNCHFNEIEELGAGLVVDINVDKIVCSMLKLMEDSSERIKMGKKARQIIEEKYSWGVIVDKMIKKYEEILRVKDEK